MRDIERAPVPVGDAINSSTMHLLELQGALKSFRSHPGGFALGFGVWLREVVGTVTQGYVLRRVGTSHNAAVWRVDMVDAQGNIVPVTRHGAFR